MLTPVELAGLIVAVFWAILVSFLAYVLLRLARVLSEAATTVARFGEQAAPLLSDVTRTVAAAGEQLDRVDAITRNMGSVTQNAAAVTSTVTSVVAGPLVKAAAFSYGVRRAVGGNGKGKGSGNARHEGGKR
jgi:uncharacterized membrane protein (UPF0182 family)